MAANMVPTDPAEIIAQARVRSAKLLAELRKHEAELAKPHAALSDEARAAGHATLASAATAAERLLARLGEAGGDDTAGDTSSPSRTS
ncbi:MAG TPA: hypothetical protein VK324_12210 [Tepidisphaeraceae bacterium]|nr:hypothetical protein [Tepidisphaeraceae bacterium]